MTARGEIVVRGLGKVFRRYPRGRAWTLQEAALAAFRRRRVDRFWALRDVTFHVAPGRMVGFVGMNGAGKSTLLRLIGGVGRPDEGTVEAGGRVGALLELGAGFHPDLTGREGVFVNGVIGGLTRGEVAARFDAIVAFAELEAFIDSPIRTYSSGMQMRLGFSVAVHSDPDLLLVDEVLAVGDASFQEKCRERISRFRAEGCTIVLVSHDIALIRELCDEALWLRDGRVAASGPPAVVVERYLEEGVRGRAEEEGGAPPSCVQIRSVRLLDREGRPVDAIDSGGTLRVEMEIEAHDAVLRPLIAVMITRGDGHPCCSLDSERALDIGRLEGRQWIRLELDRLDLQGGAYFVDIGCYAAGWVRVYDYHHHRHPLLVHGGPGRGILLPPHGWSRV